MLGSLHPADHLDSTHTCLNNPENHQKTSRTDSPEPSVDERPMEEGRKGGEAVHTTQTGRKEPGREAACWQSTASESGLQKQKGLAECVLAASRTEHLKGYKLTAVLREREGRRTMGGRVVEPRMTEPSVAGEKGARQCHLPSHPQAKIPKGTSSCQGTCLHCSNTQGCASADPSLQRV